MTTQDVVRDREFRRQIVLLGSILVIAFAVLLFAESESRWFFSAIAIAGGLINPSIRFILLHCGVVRPADRQTPKTIRAAESVLILSHMFRVMFAGLAPVAIVGVAIELSTSGSHSAAQVIGTILSGLVLWAAAISVTCYMVKCSKRDLEKLYKQYPPIT